MANGNVLTKINEATGLGRNILWILLIIFAGYAQYVSFTTHVNEQEIRQELVDSRQDKDIEKLANKMTNLDQTNVQIRLSLARIETEIKSIHKDILELKKNLLKN